MRNVCYRFRLALLLVAVEGQAEDSRQSEQLVCCAALLSTGLVCRGVIASVWLLQSTMAPRKTAAVALQVR